MRMKRALLTAIFLVSSAPAMALDVEEFVATMSMGTPATTSSQADATITAGAKDTDTAPKQKTRPRDGGLSLQSVWMIGVFR